MDTYSGARSRAPTSDWTSRRFAGPTGHEPPDRPRCRSCWSPSGSAHLAEFPPRLSGSATTASLPHGHGRCHGLLVGTLALAFVGTIASPTDYAVLGHRPVTSQTYLAARTTGVLVNAAEATVLSGTCQLWRSPRLDMDRGSLGWGPWWPSPSRVWPLRWRLSRATPGWSALSRRRR